MKDYNRKSLITQRDQQPKRIGLSSSNGSGQGQSAEDYSIDLEDILEPLRRGKWIILGICVLFVAGATAYTMTLEPTYEASSIVSIESKDQPSSTVLNRVGLGSGTPELASEVGVLENSMELAENVAAELKATARASDAYNEEQFPILYDEEGDTLATSDVADRLPDHMNFRASSSQGMIRIYASSESPEEAASIANIYAQEYQNFTREQSRAGVAAARGFLEDQLAKREEQIRQLENQWENFARSNQVVTQGEGGERLVQEYSGLTAKRDELEFQLEQQRERLQMLQDQLEQYRPNLRESVGEQQTRASLQSEIDAINEKIAQLKAEAEPYYIRNPDLRGNEEEVPELADIQRRIEGFQERKEELTDQLVAQAAESDESLGENSALGRISELRGRIEEQRLEIQQTEAQIRELESRLGTYEGQLEGIPRQAIEREQLNRQLNQAEEFHAQVAEQLQRTIIAEESELGYVNLVRAASVPATPVSPDLKMNILLGLLLGLVVGTGVAFVRAAANKQVHKPEDLQESGYSLVGVIPRMDREIKASFEGRDKVEVDGRELSTRLMPLLNPWSPISENYRLVRTNLQNAGYGEGVQMVLVTSPEPSDGKTVTATNLAITIAQSGRRTLLIDTDLRRPSMHELLGTPIGPGVAEVLKSEGDVEIQAHATDVQGLHFLPAGKTDTPPAEMLGSDRMKQLLRKAREEYDAVIIDSPPVLAVSDPLLLATECDATIMVASAEQTDLRALEVARQTLEAVDVPIAGVIFNRYDAESAGGSYKYGYGYGYRDYDYTSAQ